MATTIPTPSPKPVTEPPKPYTFHPYADIFPLLEGPAFDALVEDIRERGQQEPIWLYEGKILDGRNRYRALQQLGREPTKVQTYRRGARTHATALAPAQCRLGDARGLEVSPGSLLIPQVGPLHWGRIS